MSEKLPNLADQNQPPYPNYGYQTYDQQQAQPGYNPQLGYSVPSITNNDINAPNRWRRWLGYNCLAFILSCVMLPLGCCVIAIFMAVLRSGFEQLIESSNIDFSGALTAFALLILPLFLTISVASLIQRSALHHHVSARSWMLGSALSGIGALFLAVMLLVSIVIQLGLKFNLSNYLLGVTEIFLITSMGIGLFQWWQLRAIATNAWHWPIVLTATWTSLGILIFGLLIGPIIN